MVVVGVKPVEWLGDGGLATALGCVEEGGQAGYKRVGEYIPAFILCLLKRASMVVHQRERGG